MSDMMNRHADSAAVVTGGAQGLGLAIATQLVNEGCRRVVMADLNAEKLEASAAELRARGVTVKAVALNLTDVEACLGLIDTAVGELGTVNVLVNAAALGARDTIVDCTLDQWDRMFFTNVRAPFFLMQGFVKHRIERGGGGAIVNICSNCAHCGQSYLASYSASKGALVTLTKNVANAQKWNRIRCNAILPGWMDTPGENITQRKFHGATDGWLERAEAAQPMKQLAKPHQLACLASFMLAPSAGVMTGAVVDYDQQIPGSYPE
ncbi:Oxidoreductase, short chain dehydrogenase/reductase family [uncultured Pleomorphomonas sp.]|uniref:Oxidoreductase, short chain dehydrogenase/reductase family n=1 Tax=uncultured Pleomorphomonas sp. TaxID=442121 RepID=A0A212L4I6_9HYPH|nr:SDR family oxidoreductase [uncultured Pleomorphomonas sp.]SCM72435.1 Oxidoreductase, short chain dehydrogenase/reductase family [uncultured Pleomorphomonas sp.]